MDPARRPPAAELMAMPYFAGIEATFTDDFCRIQVSRGCAASSMCMSPFVCISAPVEDCAGSSQFDEAYMIVQHLNSKDDAGTASLHLPTTLHSN